MPKPFNPAIPPETAGKLECEKFCRELSPAWRKFYNTCAEVLAKAVEAAGGVNEPPYKILEKLFPAFQDKSFRETIRPIIAEFCAEAAIAQLKTETQLKLGAAASAARRSEQGQQLGETEPMSAPPSGGPDLPMHAGEQGDQAVRETHLQGVSGSPTGSLSPGGQAELGTQGMSASSEQSGGGDQAAIETLIKGVSPPLVKSPPRPEIKEPSASRRRAMLTASLSAAHTILDKHLPTGPGHHTIAIGDLPTSIPRLKKLESQVGRRGKESAITYNVVRRFREILERNVAHVPAGSMLKDILSIRETEDLVEGCRYNTTIETLFLVPKELDQIAAL